MWRVKKVFNVRAMDPDPLPPFHVETEVAVVDEKVPANEESLQEKLKQFGLDPEDAEVDGWIKDMTDAEGTRETRLNCTFIDAQTFRVHAADLESQKLGDQVLLHGHRLEGRAILQSEPTQQIQVKKIRRTKLIGIQVHKRTKRSMEHEPRGLTEEEANTLAQAVWNDGRQKIAALENQSVALAAIPLDAGAASK
jgi:hypothetical protein